VLHQALTAKPAESLFSEMPRREILGKWASESRYSRKPGFRYSPFSETERHEKSRGC
jgi:hypothetical protein